MTHERYEIDNADILDVDVWAQDEAAPCRACGAVLTNRDRACPSCGTVVPVCVGACGACVSPICVGERTGS